MSDKEVEGGGEEGLDEMGAQEMAEQLVHLQQTSSGDSSKKKQRRAALLEWMLQHERNEFDVGIGTAEVAHNPQPIKINDLIAFTLKDDHYGWSDAKIEEFIQIMADTKDRIADIKPVLKIRVKRKPKATTKSKRPRSNNHNEEEEDEEEDIATDRKRSRTENHHDEVDEKHVPHSQADVKQTPNSSPLPHWNLWSRVKDCRRFGNPIHCPNTNEIWMSKISHMDEQDPTIHLSMSLDPYVSIPPPKYVCIFFST